jgi:nucleotide-binding universal stress UspA family protein
MLLTAVLNEESLVSAKSGENMKILVATDGSKYSEAAARTVAAQFRAPNEVLVLQVVEPVVYSTPPQMAPGYAPEMAARLEEQLKHARESVARCAELLRAEGCKVDTRVAENEVRTAILDTAQEWHAELVVVGSHGQKGLRRFLLGSIAEFIARHARCSVLIVRIPQES